ncbi:MAG TPA: sigma-70 family RNA polymerase sigma factor, partial [Urbifossiella sp.]|nr:sigma-70 family RNA polymerase sigma factor [Urbifossiella sp.]
MTEAGWREIVRTVAGMDGRPDAELLGRFVAVRDQAAFAALVARHGPMVLAVCRRAARDEHDAEDACQAAFLVLARSAAAVRERASVAGWLGRVARRLARKAAAASARRRAREASVTRPDPARPDTEASRREVRAALDEEFARLPEKLRAPLVLCCVEGLSRDEAAALLGLRPSTLRGRLEMGRARLRAALTRRGVALPAALVLAAAEPPAGFAAATAKLAADFVAGGPARQAPRSVVLAHEGMIPVLTTKLTAMVFGLVVVGVGAVLAAGRPDDPAPQGQPPPAAGKEGTAADALPPGAVARLGSTRLRTAATAVAVAPDGRTLRTATGGRTLGRWDADAGRLLDETHLTGSKDTRCWFSPDGRFAAAPDGDGIGVYDAATGKRAWNVVVDDKSWMSVAALTADGRTLATAEYESRGNGTGAGHVRVWSAGGGSKRVAELPSYVNGLAFAPDGKRVFAAVDNHSLRCWDAATGREVWRNDHWASHLAVSPDGALLASDTYQDGPLRLWDAATGAAVATLDGGTRVWSRQVGFGPDGRTVAHGRNDGVLLWDVGTRRLAHRLAAAGPVFAFAPDGRSVFTVGPLLGRWDTQTGRSLDPDVRGDGHVGPVLAVAFAADGKAVATAGDDGTVRVWDRAAGTHKSLPGRAARDVLAFAPGGRLLVAGTDAGVLKLLDVGTGKEVRRFALPQLPECNTDVASARVTPDGRLVAVGVSQEQNILRGGTVVNPSRPEPVCAWNLGSGERVENTSVACPPWSPALLSPDGRFVAVGPSGDGGPAVC